MSRTFSTIGVVGLGTMGAGIVEVFARAGLSVVGVEPDASAVERGRDHLITSTSRAVARGRLSADDLDALIARVDLGTDMAALAAADLVIEAVPEVLALKRDVFAAVGRVARPDTVLATNTSSLSVTEIAASTSRPAYVVGMHFFNPAPVLRLVEVVRTAVTAPQVVDDVAYLARRLGKAPVVIGDRAGFIANALLFGYLNQAVGLLATGAGTRDGIDAAVRSDEAFPMGPFALLDLIGLDTSLHILEAMQAGGGAARHTPAPLLAELVAAGRLGRKTGHGFFTYEAPGSRVVTTDEDTAADMSGNSDPGLVELLLSGYLLDARQMADDGYASRADIDTAMTLGCGFPAGPFALMAARRA